MSENKGQTIFLSVIGIATLLVAIIGATFAYFTTTMEQTPAVTGEVSTATVGAVTLSGTTFSGENILPGWASEVKSFTVSVQNLTGDSELGYECKMVKTGDGTSTDFEYVISPADDNLGSSWTVVPLTETTVATGTLTASNTSDVFKVQFRFNETGSVQTNQGQTFGAKVTCALTKTEFKQ